VPASSPLAKVRLGMSKPRVMDAVGPPTSERNSLTWKAWVLFYFGNDARRTVWFYKGMGRVVFANGNIYGGGTSEVLQVEYDPNESGVAR